MKTLEEVIAMVPEGYGWCLRNDEKLGFMGNVTTPDFENSPGAYERRQCFPVYAGTPQEALEMSIEQAKALAHPTRDSDNV